MPITKKRWTRILLPLLLLYIMNFIDRNNLSFAVVGGMNKDISIDNTMAGLAGGIFYLGYIIFQIQSGIWAERYNTKKLIMILAVSWGALAVIHGFVHSGWELLFLRFLLGLVDGAVWTMILVLIARWFPDNERSTSNSVYLFSLPLSFIIMGPISGVLIEHAGWRWLFVIEGLPAILVGIIFYYVAANRPQEASWLPSAEKEYILSGQKKTTHEIQATGYRQAILHPQVLLMSAVYFFWLIGAVGFFMWVPAIIKTMSNSGIANVGFISTFPYIAALLGLIILGRISDRTNKRSQFVGFSLFCFGIFLLLSSLFSQNYVISLVFLILAGFFLFATHAPFWAIPVQMFSPQMRGAAMGMISLIGNVGSFIGPYFVGYVKDTTGSFNSGMYVLVASLIIASLLTLGIKKSKENTSNAGLHLSN